jgi:TRAP-type C4-dicarboxylate transport system permease small subunit
MDKCGRVVGVISRYADYIARLGMLALLVLVIANVILRYGWKSIQGTYDYVGLITATSVALAISYCAYERGHIEVEILMERFPQRVQAIVGSVVTLISAGFFGMASWQSVVVGISMKAAHDTTMAVYVPLYPFMYILAFGLGLMVLVILMQCVKHISKAVNP